VFPADLERHLGHLVLGAARSMPLVWLIPAFGGPTLSLQLRLAFVVALSALCLPIVSVQVPNHAAMGWTVLFAREVLVGAVMGFVCACWFRAAEAAGGLIDVLSGYGVVDARSPGGRGSGGPFAAVMLLLAVVIFFEIGGVGHVTLALARSYDAIPLSTPFRIAPAAHAMAMAATVASGKLIESALGLCAPVLVALFLADLVLALMGRAVPQIPVYSLGVPLKALLGVGVVLLGLGGIHAALQGRLAEFLAIMRAATEMGR
jgi:flagellar biosynthesis protein FliR